MKKGIYPIIAILKFRSKHLRVDLPIRVRYFELKRNECKKCKSGGTLADFSNYYKREYDIQKSKEKKGRGRPKKQITYGMPMVNFEINRQTMSMPEAIFKNINTIYCPKCLLQDKKKVITTLTSQPMYTMYCTTAPNYVKVQEIIYHHLNGRWKLDEKSYHREKSVVYLNTLEECYDIVNAFKKLPTKKRTKRGQKMMINVVDDITEKQLKKLYQKSLRKSFARKI